MRFCPRPYQTIAWEHLLTHDRPALWAGMGLGKTASTLHAINTLRLIDPRPTLVLAPLRVATSTWVDEVAKWEDFHHLEVSPVVGNLAQRKRALKHDAAIYTINYENIPWLVESLVGKPMPFSLIVADESTKLKGFRLRQGGQRTKYLAQIAHKAPRFIELTGTPSPNGLIDLWGQMWFLDKGRRLGSSFRAFLDRWFKRIQAGNDPRAVRYEPHEHAQAEIEARLQDICLSINAADWFDLREPIVNTIFVKLPEKAFTLYKKMEKEMFLELACGAIIEVLNAAAKTMKCLQLANGAIYTDESCEAFAEIHDVKIQALEEIIAEAVGAPVLVAYQFKSDLARLSRAFPQARTLDNNPQTIRDWNAGKIPVLLAHPASAGHGLNLQDGGNIIVFFGHWWDLEQYQQMVERIGATRQKQSGHERPVFIHHIIAKGTIDEVVVESREKKIGVQDALMSAMKRA